MHSQVQHKKPHFQYKLYQECGFLYWCLQRSSAGPVRVGPGQRFLEFDFAVQTQGLEAEMKGCELWD
eukprot:2041918-Rhodomonas_salina.1